MKFIKLAKGSFNKFHIKWSLMYSGGSLGGSSESSFETKLFHFHGEFLEKSGKINKSGKIKKSNPLCKFEPHIKKF